MKTLKANNLQQALKELKAIDGLTDQKIETLKSTIREADKKVYHVILVKKIHDAANQKYLVSFIVQQYVKRAFDKLKNGISQLGFDKAIILHDPTQLNDEADTTQLSTFEKQQIEEKVKKELEAKHKAELDAVRKQYEDDAKKAKAETTNNGGDDVVIVSEIEVATAKKDDLLKFATDNKIELGDDTKVDVIRPIIAKWIEDNTKIEE